MPEFLKDSQMKIFQNNPEPVKLGKRIEDAAARGPRENDDEQDGMLLLENGKSDKVNGTANGTTSSNGILARFTGRKSSSKEDQGDGEGLEVMV